MAKMYSDIMLFDLSVMILFPIAAVIVHEVGYFNPSVFYDLFSVVSCLPIKFFKIETVIALCLFTV